tara:strand:- start:1044 stop:1454 length:411 start_codon:yes stop_codon:yes gene_type:complete
MITPGDLDTAARTVWGEARGESQEGRRAVAHVLVNRWRADGGVFARDATLTQAATRHRQFSSWNPDDPNLQAMQKVTLNNAEFRACMRAVLESVDSIHDPTFGSKHYHASHVSPDWAKGHGPAAHVGAHVFYSDIS